MYQQVFHTDRLIRAALACLPVSRADIAAAPCIKCSRLGWAGILGTATLKPVLPSLTGVTPTQDSLPISTKSKKKKKLMQPAVPPG